MLYKSTLQLFAAICLILPNCIGQCGYDVETVIADLSATSMQLQVSNAANNDLSSSTQCVKEISLEFRHQFVGDLWVDLTSPAGQTVRLMGPGLPSSSPTQLIRWDITMVSCDSTAIPDLGFPAIWDNIAPWAILSTYEGSYYPYDGCLEDFDVGPVNGVWTLSFEDISEIGDGVLQSFTITFCDGSEIVCGVCEIAVPQVSVDTSFYCDGDAIRVASASPIYPANYVIDTSRYTYSYGVFASNVLVDYNEAPAVADYIPGSYELCPLTFESSLVADMPAAGSILSPAAWVQSIEDLEVCAVASSSCHPIVILPRPDTLRNAISSCLGSPIVYGGSSYMTSDTLYELISGTVCDTVLETILEFIDPQPLVADTALELTCIDDQVWLYLLGDYGSNTSYQWSTVGGNILDQQGDSLLVNAAGLYAVTVTDRGCSGTTEVTVSSDDTQPTIDVEFTTFDCVTDTVPVVIDASEVLTIRWQRPNMSLSVADTLLATSPGLYQVTATAGNGCQTIESFEIEIDTMLVSPTASAVPITCADPETTINVVGVLSSYDYSWVGPGFISGDLMADNLTVGGDYTLTYSGPNGCIDSLVVEVVDQREQPALDIRFSPVNCDSLGTPATIASDLSISNVSWSALSTGTVVFGDSVRLFSGGLYEITYSTESGCIRDTIVDIPVDTLQPILAVTGGTLDCVIDSIQIDVIGDTSRLDFFWTGPGGYYSDSLRPFVSIAGDYTLIASGDNNCPVAYTAVVSRSADRPDVEFSLSPITCNNDTATISVSDKSYDFLWSDNLLALTSDSFRMAMPIEVFVTVTDGSTGCDDTYSFDIEDLSSGPRVDIDGPTFECNTDSIQLTVVVQDSLSDFSWSGVTEIYQDSIQPFLQAPDTVILTSTDVYGCSAVDTFVPVDRSSGPTITFADTTLTCDRPLIELEPMTDIPLDSVVWSGPGLASAAISVSVNTPGIYILEAYSGNGCVTVVEQEVSLDNLPPTVLVVQQDTLRCTHPMATIEIAVDTFRSITWRDPTQNVVGDSLIIETNQAGRYTVSVEGINGCTSTTNVDLISEIVFPQVVFDIDQLDCDTDTATVTATSTVADHTYRWLAGQEGALDPSITVQNPGSYPVAVTNALGCIDTFTAVVVWDTIAPDPTLLLEDTISCVDPQVYITGVTSDYEYRWIDINGQDVLQDTLLVSQPGIYDVELIGLNGCSILTSLEVPIDTNALTIDVTADTLSCAEGKVSALVVGNKPVVNAVWSGPLMYSSTGAEVTVFSPGTYIVTASGPNGCETTDSVVVIKDESMPSFAVEEVFLPCDDSGAELSITTMDSIYTLRWFGPDAFFSEDLRPRVFVPGRYIVVASGASGCPASDTLDLGFDTELPSFGAIIDTFFCDQQMIDLLATDVADDAEVRWIGPGGFDVSSALTTATDTGLYQLIVTGLNRCRDTLLFRPYDDRQNPVIELTQVDSLVCNQTEVTLSGIATDSLLGTDFSLSWITGGTIVGEQADLVVSAPGVYTFHVTNNRNRCSATADITVEQLSYPQVDYFLSLLDATCEGFNDAAIFVDSVVGGFAPYEFSLDGMVFQDVDGFEFLAGGNYTVVSSDRYGCIDSVDINLAVGANPAVELPLDTTLILGDSLRVVPSVSSGNGLETFLDWSSNESLQCDTCASLVVEPWNNLWLSVTVTDDLGCESSDEMLIILDRRDEVDLPNVFRPDGDPLNRIFYFPDVPGVESVESMRIYDRQGSLMYESFGATPGDPSYGWDGTLRGEFALSAVYTFQFNVIYVDGSTKKFVGDVTLLR